MKNSLVARLCATLVVLGLFVCQAVAEEVLPVLQTKTDSYANVTVISRTGTHVFVKHSRGVANIKLSDLDVGALTTLGFSSSEQAAIVGVSSEDAAGAVADSSANRLSALAASVSGMVSSFREGIAPHAQLPDLSRGAVYGILGGAALAYLFFCYCSMLICKRTANKPGISVWLPVVQVFPLLRAAGMSRWWFLATIVPLIAPLAYGLWCVKIARACGRGFVTAILLFLPITGIFTYIYLALSGKGAGAKGEFTGIKQEEMEPLPA